MSNSSTDNAIVFQYQEIGHRGIGESLLLDVSARIVSLTSQWILTAAVIPAVPAPLWEVYQHQLQLDRIKSSYRMATLVFWHVALRVSKGEPLVTPRRAKWVPKMLRALTCIVILSIGLGVLQAVWSFEGAWPLPSSFLVA